MRVSAAAQDVQLHWIRCVRAVQRWDVFSDVASGCKAPVERPGMKQLLDHAEAADTLVVWRADVLIGLSSMC